jgi:predicted DsbA family dithiol-disulfide isomerase
VASAYSLGLRGVAVFKDLLYRALWCEGADLSDPATIAYLAEKAGLGRTVLSALDNRLASATTSRWQQDWEATGIGAVPALVRPDGTRLMGLVGQDRLRAFLRPAHSTAKRP